MSEYSFVESSNVDVDKNELNAFEHATKKDSGECDIPLGKLCCFKPIDQNGIYFGHVAGKVVDDFEKMSFMYVLKSDNQYFFSKEVIVKPDNVHTSKDAEKYFQ